MSYVLYPSFRYLAAIALIASPAAAFAAGVDAGTLIENTASATFDVGAGAETISSNTVTIKVNEVLDVTVASLDAGQIGTGSGAAVLTFELTNTGNGPEAFFLNANPAVSGNDFDVTVDGIAVDTNGNGVYDAGVDEILTGPATTDILPADGKLTVFVLVTVPASAADGKQSTVDLTATAVTGSGTPGTTFAGQGVSGSDAIVGAGSASDNATGSLLVGKTSVSLIKQGTVADPFGGTSAMPGAVITYTITANIAGSGSVSGLVINDVIPGGTTYRAGTLTLDSSALSDASGDDAGTAGASGISVSLGNVPGGTSRVVAFEVTIN